MKAMDSIIGYTAIKHELKQISDTLKNSEFYDKRGVTAPRGLLLYGNPGVGKTLMATAIIEESGRVAFTCRKDKPNGDFIKHIKSTFDKAAESVPSIVYLDDMDKFTNGDARHPDAEEYVTVQSCIDYVKDKNVFVLATVNNIQNLPPSLRRAGRFDRIINIEAPRGKDAEMIIAHYLGKKKFVDGVDPKAIARIMDGRSCAELETVINEAGLIAGYHRMDHITMDHFMQACMKTVFNITTPPEEINTEDPVSLYDPSCLRTQIAWHEAGHAVISEVLCPGSVTLISTYTEGHNHGGFTAYYNEYKMLPLDWNKSRIVTALGGIAAIDQIFGIVDSGSNTDLNQAFVAAMGLVSEGGVCGLHLRKCTYDVSDRLRLEQEHATAVEIERYYKKAKEILAKNRDFLSKLAEALLCNVIITMSDVKKIKDSCRITPVYL